MKKYHIYLTYDERQEIVYAMMNKRNDLIRTGHYTDAVDEIIGKVVNAKIKRVKVLLQKKQIFNVVKMTLFQTQVFD